MVLDLSCLHFLVVNFDCGKNIFIFDVESGSSEHIDNRKKYILILN